MTAISGAMSRPNASLSVSIALAIAFMDQSPTSERRPPRAGPGRLRHALQAGFDLFQGRQIVHGAAHVEGRGDVTPGGVVLQVADHGVVDLGRSEERRVGKECRCGWWRYDCKNE